LTTNNFILIIIPIVGNKCHNTHKPDIWDQTIQDGPPPEGYLFGTEYTREDINRALQAEDPFSIVPSLDEIGHGSAIASVAAGSNVHDGRTFLGAAPDATIVVVKLKECKHKQRSFYLIPDEVPAYSEQDIMFGVQYADSFTIRSQRPVVICLGLGSNFNTNNLSSPVLFITVDLTFGFPSVIFSPHRLIF